MFDMDQDVEILAVIQAAHNYRLQESLDTPRMFRGKVLHDLGLHLDDAIEKIIEKYGEQILTYDIDDVGQEV